MGTRADFYVGRGETAEWLGSVAFDGYPDGFDDKGLFNPCSESEWRAKVQKTIAGRDDGTTPDMGWPWPWTDSRTTDYAYAWDGGVIWGSCFGHAWFDPGAPAPEEDENGDTYCKGRKVAVFPDMKSVQKVTFGDRSGAIFLQLKGRCQ